jgi:hypothetical protein
MWEETFEAYLGTLLQKPTHQLFTREKTEIITNVLMNGQTDWCFLFKVLNNN